jgi:hypothetical protein
MKIAELVSALEELGTIYRHSSKNEPKPCIAQVLALLEGKEHLRLSELGAELTKKKATARKSTKATKVSRVFDQEQHLTSLLDAKTETAFIMALESLKKAKPTNDNLAGILTAYTGVTVKKGRKKDELYGALLRAFKAELRHEARAEVSRNNVPI